MKQILEDHDDPLSLEVKNRLIYFFGKALGQIITFLDPDLVILGGGLSNLNFLYSEGKQAVSKNIFNPVLNTPIVQALLGDSAGVFGAAMLTRKD